MLTRIRLEVSDEDSAAATSEALGRYEHALQVVEAQRHDQLRQGNAKGEKTETFDGSESAPPERLVIAAQVGPDWDTPVVDRGFYNYELGREVTDEVIEYDASLPGYKGRRVVQFRRLDTRGSDPAPTAPPKGFGSEPLNESPGETSITVHGNGHRWPRGQSVR